MYILNRAIIVAIAKIKRLHMKRGSRVMGKKESGKFGSWLKKYKHAWVFLYIFIYMPWFLLLEKHVTTNYHVIQTQFDMWIPFVEYFIIPYLMWFAFIAAAFVYFFFTDVPGFYKMAKFMFTGMTIFLIISTIFPNGQDLRPVVFERDNVFVDMVRMLYRADTCTNVFPSLHVFNTLSVCIAVHESEKLKKHKAVCNAAYILVALIILATMFLKQHSVLDVFGAVIMAYVLYKVVYEPEKKMIPQLSKQKFSKQKRIAAHNK